MRSPGIHCLWVLVIGVLAGCASGVKPQAIAPFDAAQAKKGLSPGANSIHGAAYLWLSTGGLLSCAGESATLYPATAYARQWAKAVYQDVENGKAQPPDFFYRPANEEPHQFPVDSAFLAHARTVACDPEGQFSFENVADGDFFVVAKLVWQRHVFDEHSYFYGKRYHDFEGSVIRPVHVQGGIPTKAKMTWSVPNTRLGLW